MHYRVDASIPPVLPPRPDNPVNRPVAGEMHEDTLTYEGYLVLIDDGEETVTGVTDNEHYVSMSDYEHPAQQYTALSDYESLSR